MASKTRAILPLPTILEPSTRVCFCIQIPNDPEHFAAFWGALAALGKRYSWGKPLTDDSEIVALYWLRLLEENRVCFEEALGMVSKGCGCEGEPDIRRIRDGEQGEISFDDGLTWQPDPDDTRFTQSLLPFVPLSIQADPACSVANGIVAGTRAFTTEILGAANWDTLATFVAAMLTVITTFVGPIGTFIAALISAVALLIFSLSRQAILDAMTDAVYDQLLCIIYCCMKPSTELNQVGWNCVKAKIATDISGIANPYLWNLVNILGPVPLTNIGRTLHNTSESCVPCLCGEGCEYTINTGTLVSDDNAGTIIINSAPEPSQGNREQVGVSFGSCCFVVATTLINPPNGNFFHYNEDCNFGTDTGAPDNDCWSFISFYTPDLGDAFTISITTNRDTACP